MIKRSVKDLTFIDFQTFRKEYDLKSISYFRITKSAKKTYLNSIFLLNFLLFLLYLLIFSWKVFILHIFLHFICFIFFDQYNYSIEFYVSDKNLKYKLNHKEIDLFYQIENEYHTQQNLIFYYKNEPSFKSNIGSQQLSS